MLKFPLLILSAGFGKRMLDLTENLPKPLLKVDDQTLLANTIEFFLDLGCNDFFINSHYLHHKIQNYINKNFDDYPINLIYEPSILGTGGAVKNVFKYTKNNNICVVNSDIFWQKYNKSDIKNFLEEYHHVTHCKILLSKKENFFGLQKMEGDFNFKNETVLKWKKGNEVIFYSGLQIVSKNIFKNLKDTFSMNEIWNELIFQKNLKGALIQSKISHIGDKNSFVSL